MSDPLSTLELSVVTTMYHSAAFVRPFYERVTRAAQNVTDSYEIVLVDDGSPDNSLAEALQLVESDQRVRVIELSRNFGHHPAILAGLRHSRGRLIFLIDIDLEEQPEWLPEFWQDLKENNADMVYGVQTGRSGPAVKRHTGSLFYHFFNLASDTKIPPNGCTVRLMKRCYLDAIGQLSEAHVFVMGLFSWTGFTQRPRYVTKLRRESASTYTPLKLIALSINALTSFSSYPLTIIFVGGAAITLLSLVYAGGLIIEKLLHPAMILSGFASIMVSLWFLGGTIISVLGVIGMYVGKIFVEAKRRPQYLVRSVYEPASARRSDPPPYP